MSQKNLFQDTLIHYSFTIIHLQFHVLRCTGSIVQSCLTLQTMTKLSVDQNLIEIPMSSYSKPSQKEPANSKPAQPVLANGTLEPRLWNGLLHVCNHGWRAPAKSRRSSQDVKKISVLLRKWCREAEKSFCIRNDQNKSFPSIPNYTKYG